MISDVAKHMEGAFTIWELLCVVLVIILLFGLLMPALSRVRRISTDVICLSYLREYSMAGLLYLGDNDEVFPEGPDEWLYAKASISQAHPIGCRWHDRAMAPGGDIMSTNEEYQGRMWSYVSETALRPCPSFRRFARSRGCENPDHNKELDIEPQYSYTMNGYLGSPRDGGILRVSEARKPTDVFFFAEENCWSLRPNHPEFPAGWLSAPLSTKALDDTVLVISPSPEANDCFATYHRPPSGDLNCGSGNVAFLDGHTESMRAEDQLRKTMHGGNSRLGPAGNLSWAWASESPPPGGWDAQ